MCRSLLICLWYRTSLADPIASFFIYERSLFLKWMVSFHMCRSLLVCLSYRTTLAAPMASFFTICAAFAASVLRNDTYVKRYLYMWNTKRDLIIWKGNYTYEETCTYQKRPTEETYKRDLQKRPTKETYKSKEETIHMKKPARIKRDLQKWTAKETYRSDLQKRAVDYFCCVCYFRAAERHMCQRSSAYTYIYI